MKKYYFHEFSNTIIYRPEMIILIAFRQLISTRMTSGVSRVGHVPWVLLRGFSA